MNPLANSEGTIGSGQHIENLRQHIESHGPYPPREVAQIGLQLVSAVETRHLVEVHHHDLRPRNINFVGGPGLEVEVTRRGLEVVHDGGEASPYLAPEYGTGEMTAAADVYSLGALLWFLATGRDPLGAEESMGHGLEDALPPDFLDEDAATLSRLLAQMMDTSPKKRVPLFDVELSLDALGRGEMWEKAAHEHDGLHADAVVATTTKPANWQWLVLPGVLAAIVLIMVVVGLWLGEPT